MDLEKTKGDINKYMDDATITTKVKAKFVGNDLLKSLNIHVVTNEGVVTLTGAVPDGTDLDTIEELARSVEGVKEVQNKLETEE